MRKVLILVAVICVGTATAVSFPKVCPVPCDYCSEYEVLQTTPPCCEATCDADCSRVVCPKMLVYQPTCVCLEGLVRHDGQCIPKSCCPMPVSPCESATTAAPCGTTTPSVPCETTLQPCVTTKPPCTTTAAPPCPTTACPTPCPTSGASYSLKPSNSYGYTPPSAKCTQSVYVPPPPPPSYQTIPPYRYSSKPLPTPCPTKTVRCTTTPEPCRTTTPPCTTTPAPCPTTTTSCQTTKPPYSTAPVTCAACEQLVFAKPCCEPSCDFDCSDAACPILLVEEGTCACQPGLVRYQGHCIEPAACPQSASRYRLYVPVEAHCVKCNGEAFNNL